MNIKDITPEHLWQNGINPEGMLFGPNFFPYNPRREVGLWNSC